MKPNLSANAASTAPGAPRSKPGDLLLMTCLSAVDGTILVLAASGRLDSWTQAIVVGLTVVSGTGAWIAAREAFRGHRTARDYALLGGLAALSMAATMVAAWLGTALGTAVTLHVLPKAAGVVLFLVAAEVGGLRVPRPGGVPAPVLVLAAGLLLEVGRWIP